MFSAFFVGGRKTFLHRISGKYIWFQSPFADWGNSSIEPDVRGWMTRWACQESTQ